MEYVIVEYAASAVDAVINIVFLEKMFGNKPQRRYAKYIFFLLYFLAAHYMMAYLIPQMICIVLIEILYCTISLEGRKPEHIIWVVILNVIICLVSSLLIPLLAIITGKTAMELVVAGTVTRIWIMLIQKLIICAVLYGILSHRERSLHLMLSEQLIVIILLVTNIFIVSGFYVVNVSMSVSEKAQTGMFLISILIMILLIVCTVLIFKISAKNKQVMDNVIMKFQLLKQGEMIENMAHNNEEARILRHDLKHYAMLIKDYLLDDNIKGALDEVDKYIDKTTQAEQKTDYVHNNKLINAVLYNCVCECKDKAIKCSVEATARYPDEMEQDAAIMLANLLDNAIRAEMQQPDDKKYIDIHIYEENKWHTLMISNYIDESVLSWNPQLRTSKEDKNMHGLGLKSVNNVVKKYNGRIKMFEESNSFNVIVEYAVSD